MSVVGVMVVKNESDIIEASVRHNIKFMDGLIVVDNDSSDETADIISKLAAEGLHVLLRTCAEFRHRQSAIVSTALAEVLTYPDITHTFLLDADEFIVAEPHALRAQLTAHPHVNHAIQWRTYVPTPEDQWEEPDPLRRITHRRAEETAAYRSKVVVARPYFAAPILEGNHGVWVDGREEWGRPLPGVFLAHFPLRSPDQLVTKALLGGWSLALKPERFPGEGVHWSMMHDRIRRDLTVTREELRDMAASYSPVSGRQSPLVRDTFRTFPDYSLRYTEHKRDPLRAVVSFTGRIVDYVAKTQVETDTVDVRRGKRGVFAFLKSDTVIGQSLNLYGEWRDGEIFLLNKNIGPGDVVLDVGANIGAHTVPLARRVGPRGVVHAFEPLRAVYHLLCGNVALNGLTNVIAHHAAVSAEDGKATVPQIDIDAPDAAGAPTEEIDAIRIDGLNLPNVKLIKIASEGSVRDVVLGASDTIRRCGPLLYVRNNVKDKSAELVSQIRSFGYKCWWHIVPCFNPINHYNSENNVFLEGSAEINLFCTPLDFPVPTDLPEALDPIQPWIG